MSTTFFSKNSKDLLNARALLCSLAMLFCSLTSAQEAPTGNDGANDEAQENPSLGFLPANGYAKYTEFDQDLYVAALFLARPASDPREIRDLQSKRMEFKIAHERLAYKRFGQILIKSSAINNPPKALVENAKAMERFLKLFRDNLLRGDHIVLANQAGGFLVSLNGVDLALIESPSLFNMLLNIWIGDVPPSRDFRSRMLGGDKALDFAGDFASLEYSPSRVTDISRWKTESEMLAESSAEASSSPKSTGLIVAPVVIAANAIAANVLATNVQSTGADTENATADTDSAAADTPSTTAAASDQSSTSTTAQVDAKATENISAAAADSAPRVNTASLASAPDNAFADLTSPSNSSARSLDQAKQVTPALLASAAAQRSKPVPKAADKTLAAATREDDSFSAENLLSVQLYVSKLLIHSQSKMKYPTIARRLGQQGKVVVSVTVDRKGKLKEYEITDESENRSLNVAVTKGIKRSEPFPSVPEAIEGDDFTFSVPVNFKISD